MPMLVIILLPAKPLKLPAHPQSLAILLAEVQEVNMHKDSPKSDSHQADMQHLHQVPYKRHRIDGPRPRRTSPLTWFAAIVCAVLWVLVALGGLAVLIVYLVFRPRTPRVEIPTATLNAAYVDVGVLLNADLTLLTNFSNPNHKIDISYRYMAIDLYYNVTMIATQVIEPFAQRRKESTLRNVHLLASQVELYSIVASELNKQIESGAAITFSIRGKIRTKLNFNGLAQVSYWLYTRCDLMLSAPPSGVLQFSRCSSKR